MGDKPFIGTGSNPDGPDLPLGLGMQLAQEPQAMEAYGRLSKQQQASLISFIQSGATGEDAKNRIAEAINGLKHNRSDFL